MCRCESRRRAAVCSLQGMFAKEKFAAARRQPERNEQLTHTLITCPAADERSSQRCPPSRLQCQLKPKSSEHEWFLVNCPVTPLRRRVSLTFSFWSEAGVAAFGCRLVEERAQLTSPVLFLFLSHIIAASLATAPSDRAASRWQLPERKKQKTRCEHRNS